jgi:hypothetical protein
MRTAWTVPEVAQILATGRTAEGSSHVGLEPEGQVAEVERGVAVADQRELFGVPAEHGHIIRRNDENGGCGGLCGDRAIGLTVDHVMPRR